VVLVDSWTYGCYNCVNTLPYVTKLYDTYRRRHPYPGISDRTVGRQCAGRAEAAWHHLSGGAGQRLGDLERLAQSILRRPNTSLTSTVTSSSATPAKANTMKSSAPSDAC